MSHLTPLHRSANREIRSLEFDYGINYVASVPSREPFFYFFILFFCFPFFCIKWLEIKYKESLIGGICFHLRFPLLVPLFFFFYFL